MVVTWNKTIMVGKLETEKDLVMFNNSFYSAQS